MAKIASDPFTTINQLRSKYIHSPRDKILEKHLDRLLQRDVDGKHLPKPVSFTSTGDTHGIVLVDGPGGGKTSLVHHALDTPPAFHCDDPDRQLWVGVRVPSPSTLKSLGLEILRETGYPDVYSARREWDIWRIVRHRLKELGTAVLWIDEAHDLFRAGKGVEDILKMLKSVMQGEGAVVVILTGIDSLWNIASYDDQVKRRYSKVSLSAVSASTHGEKLCDLIGKFCDEAGLEPPTDPDLVARLVFASRGRFGRCIECIIAAIEAALLRGDGNVTIQHFAEVWAMQEGVAPGNNVFLSPRWAEIDLSQLHIAA